MNLTKLCPFFKCDKIINTIANTHIVVEIGVLEFTKSKIGRKAIFYQSTSMQSQCYQSVSLQDSCFGHQLSIVSVTCEFS